MMQKRFLFNPNIFKYSLIIVFGEITIFIVYGTYIWFSYISSLNRHLHEQACHIELILKDTFEQGLHHVTWLGKKIGDLNSKDYSRIPEIVSNYKSNLDHLSQSTPHFNLIWMSAETFHRLSQNDKKPMDSYIWRCHQLPWHLHLSSPAINIPGGLWEIPGGMGITTPQTKLLGLLLIGFNIAELNANVQKNILNDSVSFVVLDDNFDITLQSSDNAIEFQNSYYRDLLKNKPELYNEKGEFKDPITYKNITYTSYKRMHDYPYLILTGTNLQYFYKEIFHLILSKLVEYSAISLFFVVIHFLILRQRIKRIAECEKARESFLKALRHRRDETLDFILAHHDLIHKYLAGDMTLGIDYQKCSKLAENINQALFDLKSLTSKIITYNYIDANTTLKECLKILIPLATREHVSIIKDKSLDLPLPSICVDELSFKQIIMGLIALSIQFTPRGGRIKISAEVIKYAADSSCELTNYDNGEFLCLRIEDTGIPLTNSDIQRLARRFDQEEDYWCFGGTNLPLESIEKLVKLHHGTFHIETKGSIGKSIKLLIPYSLQPKDLETCIPKGDCGVIINFPGKAC